jgi:hypothetical protein
MFTSMLIMFFVFIIAAKPLLETFKYDKKNKNKNN